MTIIDAHSHLWLNQDTTVDGQTIRSLKSNPSRSIFFGEERQMLPPFMIDGRNTAEVFLSNMDYAQVAAAVVVQEVIDGNQDDYLAKVQARYPDRFRCMALVDGPTPADKVAEVCQRGLCGVAIPGHRLQVSLHDLMPLFKEMERRDMVLSMCLGEEPRQIEEMKDVIQECPSLRIAIGHFGMVTTPIWESQILLAREGKHVMIESGGITWLFNSEFYPFPSAVRAIRQAADMVGIDRLMWGSDYPRTITAITYRMSYDFLFRSPLLNMEEQRLFLGENAQRFYGFDNIVDLPYIKNMSE